MPDLRLDCRGKCGDTGIQIQPNFEAQKGLLEEKITAAGHLIIFYFKCYCEIKFHKTFSGGSKMIRKEELRLHIEGLVATSSKALGFISFE